MSGFSFPYTNAREDGADVGIQPNLNFLTPAGGPYVTQDTANSEIDVDVTTMIAAASGWTDDGVVVRLNTATDRVSIGDNVGNVNYKLSIFGDAGEQGLTIQGTVATANFLAAYVTGDTDPRVRVGNGVIAQTIEFGPGNAASDWTIARQAASVAELGSGDALFAVGAATIGVRNATGDANAIYQVASTGFAGGAGGASAVDVTIVRGAANRWEAGSGDAFDVIAGGRLEHRTLTGDAQPTVQAGASAVLMGPGGATAPDVRLSRSDTVTLRIDDGALGAATVLGGADNTLTFGSAAIRVAAANTAILRVYAAAAAANPTVQISGTSIILGPGGATAPDVSITRGAVDRWEAGSGDSFDVIAGGVLEHRTLSGDANPTVKIGASEVGLGPGGVTAPDARMARTAAATLTLDNGAAGALLVLGGADNALTFGSAANRVAAANAAILRVYNAAADANPAILASGTTLQLGPGGATAPDVSLTRGAADRAELAAADSLGTLTTGAFSNRNLSADANPRMNLISDRLFFGDGGASVVDTGWRRSAAATLEWTGTLVPAATGQDIGTDALRFDLFSREVWGGQVVDVTNGMSPYTVAAGDYELHCDTSGGAITVNLPTVASSRKRRLLILKVTTDANAVTITPNGADTLLTVAGSATLAGGAVRSIGVTGGAGASVDWRGW